MRFLTYALAALLFASQAFAAYIPPNNFSGWPPLEEMKRFRITLDGCSGSINTTGIDEWVNTSSTGVIEDFDGTDVVNAPCMMQFDIGTAGGHDAAVRMAGAGQILFGQGVTRFFANIREVAVSDASNGWTLRVGFMDADGDSTDGCFFRYTDDVNSGKYQIVCRGASTETAADSGVTYTAGTQRQMAIVVNAAADSVAFYIDGVQTTNSPITGGNIPNTTTESTGCGMSATRVDGTTADTEPVAIDYMACQIEWTTPPYIQVP